MMSFELMWVPANGAWKSRRDMVFPKRDGQGKRCGLVRNVVARNRTVQKAARANALLNNHRTRFGKEKSGRPEGFSRLRSGVIRR